MNPDLGTICEIHNCLSVKQPLRPKWTYLGLISSGDDEDDDDDDDQLITRAKTSKNSRPEIWNSNLGKLIE